ncbi:MAG: nucleoside-diphosphate kinase [Selenomonadaceae bacterium]|nr:nucleoside-diphosphate kinase [Selenomonadaceae bacterium]MBR0283674.1 nucleoside-diphosphate kinase [Selenomonadaceae bacterium]MBR6342941.1 nucleoside-diphosphate kinase [Selenomonadaceae bacterium]MBR6711097.1 nucleoside-diphosphate kinase [Selenomonadaceae bacterium]MBR6905626.1 nucleoside-diphosphate kinase [Selenomonadaceae bacterium]
MEKTLVLIKPDAFANHYSGDIIKRYESEGFRIVAMKLMRMTEKIAAKHYAEHIGRPYYEGLVEFMTSAPLIAMVLEGENVIARVREINGKTNPAEAAENTIRKLYAENGSRNAVHASDSPESAEREIHIFFNETEIYGE